MFRVKQLKYLVGLILLVFGISSLSWAQTNQPDVRLFVDVSGSMKRTDPNNLRIPATNLLIDLLPEDSRAGIWTFGTYVNKLMPHGQVNSAWRNSARKEANKINSVAMHTDIEQAINQASWDINQTAADNKHIILLSDGLVDISKADTVEQQDLDNEKSRDFILRQKVNELIKAGYIVHTLALSDEADLDLMATLAQRTGGLHAVAYKDTDLMPLLLQIINRLAPQDEVALEDNKFLIDTSIDEFTLLAFHAKNADIGLTSPQGTHYTQATRARNQAWHKTGDYTLVTVAKPEAGTWQLETPEHPDNRVTVVSDVRLEATQLPPTVFRGYPLEVAAWLAEASTPITVRDFLKLLRVDSQLQRAGRTLERNQLKLEENGFRYTLELDQLSELGEQKFTLAMDGKTFNRQVTQSINVQEVVAASLQLPENSSPRVILRLQHPELNPESLSYKITANGRNLAAEYRGDGEWKAGLAELDPTQDHKIDIQVKIVDATTNLNIKLQELYLMASKLATKATALPEDLIVEEDNFVPNQTETSAENFTPLDEFSEELDENIEKPSLWEVLTNPIENWNDNRLPLVYAALGVINLLLLGGAFFFYKKFLKDRSANKDTHFAKDPSFDGVKSLNELDELEELDNLDGLDELDELDDFEDEQEKK